MSYFTGSHPMQECGECRGCPASSYHRGKCADDMHEQDERDMVKAMEHQMMLDRMCDDTEYLKSIGVLNEDGKI